MSCAGVVVMTYSRPSRAKPPIPLHRIRSPRGASGPAETGSGLFGTRCVGQFAGDGGLAGEIGMGADQRHLLCARGREHDAGHQVGKPLRCIGLCVEAEVEAAFGHPGRMFVDICEPGDERSALHGRG